MRCFWTAIVVTSCILLLVEGLVAFEATGIIQKVDAEKGRLLIRVNGQDRIATSRPQQDTVSRSSRWFPSTLLRLARSEEIVHQSAARRQIIGRGR
jgi:hypothetical protein